MYVLYEAIQNINTKEQATYMKVHTWTLATLYAWKNVQRVYIVQLNYRVRNRKKLLLFVEIIELLPLSDGSVIS